MLYFRMNIGWWEAVRHLGTAIRLERTSDAKVCERKVALSATKPSVTPEEQAALVSQLFAHAQEGMAFVDPEKKIRAANASFAAQTRISPQELVGRPLEQVISCPERDVGHTLEQVRESGEPYHGESCPFVFKEAHRRRPTRWDYSISPVFGAEHAFLGYLLLLHDVTKRLKVEQDLREAKEYSERLIETANVLIIGLDSAGRISIFNKAAEETTGYTAAELRGKNWFEVLVPKEKYPRVWRMFAHAMLGKPLLTKFENPILTKSGEERYISWRNAEIRQGGKVVGTISFGIDITERKRAEENLDLLLRRYEGLASVAQRQAAELRAVLDNMPDAVLVSDMEGRITVANEASAKLLGSPGLTEGHDSLVILLEGLRVRHLNNEPFAHEELPLVRALAGEVVPIQDEVIYNPESRRDVYIRTSAAPIRDEEGRIVGALEVARDVSDIIELEQLKDQFISVAAHELKTPLTIMKGYAQALLRTAEDLPPPRRRMLEAINRGSDRIDRIVGDLLEISLLQAGPLKLETERINLAELIEQVADRMALLTIKHNIRLVKAEPIVVQGDRDRIEQVLMNLIDNAIKYSPKGGEIDLAVSVRDREAVVSVADSGVGIPREKQTNVFQRFYSAHTSTPYDYGGMGVGLYISKEIIARHGGRMWFDSEEGKGSTFYFSLPL